MPENTTAVIVIVTLWALVCGALVGARSRSPRRGVATAGLAVAAVGCLLALRARWDGETEIWRWLSAGDPGVWLLTGAAVVFAVTTVLVVRSAARQNSTDGGAMRIDSDAGAELGELNGDPR